MRLGGERMSELALTAEEIEACEEACRFANRKWDPEAVTIEEFLARYMYGLRQELLQELTYH